MRVGKKPKVVETKRTRACVVRLEKVHAPPIKPRFVKKSSKHKETASSSSSDSSSPQRAATSSLLHDDSKKFKGPLKKRPIAQTTTPSPKFKKKYSPVAKTPKLSTETPTERSTEDTPTVTAGRSRRAIKPNPKYSSKDVVTAKIIKNVASATSRKDKSKTVDKRRKRSSSSSEDFYNKDSSDDDYSGAEDVKDDDDSDFSDLELNPTPVRAIKRPPGRPRLSINTDQTRSETPAFKRKSPSPKPTSIAKSTPSRIQLLRKTIAATNAKRLAASNLQSLTAQRQHLYTRKLYGSGNDSDSDSMAKRRKVYSGPNSSKEMLSTTLPNSFSLAHKALMARRSLTPSTTLNGSKVSHSNSMQSESALLMEKRHVLLEKAIANRASIKGLTVKSTLNPIDQAKITPKSGMKLTAARQRTASPAHQKTSSPAPNTIKDKKIDKDIAKSTKPLESSASATVDDFETMPTFTIVNINDIINKKGDVLISKTNVLSKPSSSKTPTKDYDCESSETEEYSAETLELENKSNRRKPGPSKLTEKLLSARDKKNSSLHNTSTLTPPTKKPTQTILNHTLSNKSMNKANPRSSRISNSAKTTGSTNKPAPRILNSMVAKKTQPVKPLIANLDDSADDTFAGQSLDDEDIDDEADNDSSFLGNKRRIYPTKKLTTQSGTTKENSLAAINREKSSPSNSLRSTLPRKISPEKVVISRQGDKIIKKITCFETWYIINLPEDRPAEVVRNQLDLPLIKLANATKKMDMPSANWSCKVTLFQLSPSALSKSNYATYTGDLTEHHIPEEDRTKYQPSCVMFRRAATDRVKCRLPYDRAVIFKNKTFFTNIEGKNVKLVGAPHRITSVSEVQILLQLVDELSLYSNFVEQTATVQ